MIICFDCPDDKKRELDEVIAQGRYRDGTRKQQELNAVRFVSLTNELVRTFGNARLIFDYYSENLIRSHEAKSEWTEPDLKQLDL